jgi:hypothetical protein
MEIGQPKIHFDPPATEKVTCELSIKRKDYKNYTRKDAS